MSKRSCDVDTRRIIEPFRPRDHALSLAVIRFGLGEARWGDRAIREAEERLQSLLLIPLDEATLSECVTLRLHCETSGRRLGDNDLWIAATADVAGDPGRDVRQGSVRASRRRRIYLRAR